MRVSVIGQQLRGEGHARLDGPFDLRLVILHDVFAGAVVNAGEADVRLTEEGGKSLKIGLFPLGERVIVALSAIEPQAEEGAGNAAGQSHRVGLVLLVLLAGDADEIGRRLVGPKSVVGDQVADDVRRRADYWPSFLPATR